MTTFVNCWSERRPQFWRQTVIKWNTEIADGHLTWNHRLQSNRRYLLIYNRVLVNRKIKQWDKFAIFWSWSLSKKQVRIRKTKMNIFRSKVSKKKIVNLLDRVGRLILTISKPKSCQVRKKLKYQHQHQTSHSKKIELDHEDNSCVVGHNFS